MVVETGYRGRQNKSVAECDDCEVEDEMPSGAEQLNLSGAGYLTAQLSRSCPHRLDEGALLWCVSHSSPRFSVRASMAARSAAVALV